MIKSHLHYDAFRFWRMGKTPSTGSARRGDFDKPNNDTHRRCWCFHRQHFRLWLVKKETPTTGGKRRRAKRRLHKPNIYTHRSCWCFHQQHFRPIEQSIRCTNVGLKAQINSARRQRLGLFHNREKRPVRTA